jgi:hypothetical protein
MLGIHQPATGGAKIRAPAVAGVFYPEDRQKLEETVRHLLASVRARGLTGVRAVIAPHAGYRYSGGVAAHSFKALSNLPEERYTVYLMGPAHYVPVYGVGLSRAHLFETPLGNVPVARARVEQLLALHEQYQTVEAAHKPEHCLEVELPFLQILFSDFQIVPMLFDQAADPVAAAQDLSEIMRADARSLIVVSSDLSHYHPYERAVQLDQRFLNAVVNGDIQAARAGEACGLLPILCLMEIARALGWTAHLLEYRNSGDAGGSRKEVVGYGAVAFTAEHY